MTIRQLLKVIERIKELEARGVKPDYFSSSEAGELARLLSIELQEVEDYED